MAGKSGIPGQNHSTELLDGSHAEHALLRQIHLRALSGSDQGRTFKSTSGRTVIGTHESCDFRLNENSASRFHCEIQILGERVVIRDLESRNGTLVDGTSVVTAHLHDGATLTLGRAQVRFELSGEQVAIPLHDEGRFGTMVAESRAMRAVFAVLERAARADSVLLLHGETGTGKDLAADAVHGASKRADGPFVVIDCGAVPTDLLESKLFGHERGAFTGADRERLGAFEEADGGTLFLDEIGELSLELQPKLLRVLENREIQRVGSNQRIPINVRVIAATNRNLRKEVNARTFRADLYYRLAVLEVTMPPLRERREDIPVLVDEILARLGVVGEVAARMRQSKFLAELARYSWPGNVRELRNHLERCALLGSHAPHVSVPACDDEPQIDVAQPLRIARERWIESFERRYFEALLAATGNNVTEAARRAGIDRAHIYRLLARVGLR